MFCTVGWCTWQNVFASLLLFKYKNVCNNFKYIKTEYGRHSAVIVSTVTASLFEPLAQITVASSQCPNTWLLAESLCEGLADRRTSLM